MNSRHQKRHNRVWRRRRCLNCHSVVTTLETISYEQSLTVQRAKHLEAFSRLKLLFSVHDSLRHRQNATEAAEALTDTIISRLLPKLAEGKIKPSTIIETTSAVLMHFDKAAHSHYQAFHPVEK